MHLAVSPHRAEPGRTLCVCVFRFSLDRQPGSPKRSFHEASNYETTVQLSKTARRKISPSMKRFLPNGKLHGHISTGRVTPGRCFSRGALSRAPRPKTGGAAANARGTSMSIRAGRRGGEHQRNEQCGRKQTVEEPVVPRPSYKCPSPGWCYNRKQGGGGGMQENWAQRRARRYF